jgi:hypothetical protein
MNFTTIAHTEEMININNILIGKPVHGGGIILKWILGGEGGNVLTACIWLRIGTSGGLL